MRTTWAFIFLLQILPRAGYAQNELGGIAGDTIVFTGANDMVAVRNLKDGDVIMGSKGPSRKSSKCKVITTIEQGSTELAGNFTFAHMLYDKDQLTTQARKDPSIHGLVNAHSYAVLTDCELVKTRTPKGVQHFSPLSSVFCGANQMSWSDYTNVFKTLMTIIGKTGAFWIDIRNYNDCAADKKCTVPQWRAALPPICNAMLQCVTQKEQKMCDGLNTLSNAFVSEHLPPELQSKFTKSYPAFGNSVKDMDTASSDRKKWWEDFEFWKSDINWRSPWAITFLVCLCLVINALIAVFAWYSMSEGDQYSYESFGTAEYDGTGEYDDVEYDTATRTQTGTYDDGGY